MQRSSWKTTAAGVGAILTALGGAAAAYGNDSLDVGTMATVVSAVVAAVGLILAKDAAAR